MLTFQVQRRAWHRAHSEFKGKRPGMTMGNSSQSNGAFFTLLNLPLKLISLFDVKNHHQQVILPPASAGNDTL